MVIRFRSNSELYSEFSNFALYPIVLDGVEWPTVEHYYQAQKFTSPVFQRNIRLAPHAGAAKNHSKSKTEPRRADWAEVKVGIMDQALRAKFKAHESLRALLLSTGDEELIEDVAGDAFWGCGRDGNGLNMLGQLLMRLRHELRQLEPGP